MMLRCVRVQCVVFSLLCSGNYSCGIVWISIQIHVYIDDAEDMKGRFSKVLYSRSSKSVSISAAPQPELRKCLATLF